MTDITVNVPPALARAFFQRKHPVRVNAVATASASSVAPVITTTKSPTITATPGRATASSTTPTLVLVTQSNATINAGPGIATASSPIHTPKVSATAVPPVATASAVSPVPGLSIKVGAPTPPALETVAPVFEVHKDIVPPFVTGFKDTRTPKIKGIIN